VFGLGHLHANRRRGQRQLRGVEVCGSRSGETPGLRRGRENVGHGVAESIVQIQKLPQAENLFHRAEEVNGVVPRRDQCVLLHVRARFVEPAIGSSFLSNKLGGMLGCAHPGRLIQHSFW
jgi:hypothetical protein